MTVRTAEDIAALVQALDEPGATAAMVQQALREFLATGQRPACVRWQEPI
jgi:hypothetical protein